MAQPRLYSKSQPGFGLAILALIAKHTGREQMSNDHQPPRGNVYFLAEL